MGKRSNFERRPMDAYQTIDPRPVKLLIPHLHGISRFAEPCAGEGRLVEQLTSHGLTCCYAGDIQTGQNALHMSRGDFGGPDAIITNPPWTREIMHPLIWHLMHIAPTWLLFDADWPHNLQGVAPLIAHCSHIVSVGRVRWVENSTKRGKDNCAWYRFHDQHVDGPKFIARKR
jgi:hypothetical protein